MKSIVRRSVLLALVIPLLFIARGTAADECVKRVFNRYCLGGPIDGLATDFSQHRNSDGTTTHRSDNSQKLIELVSEDGVITAVARRETPGDWLNFTHWKTKLIRLYGRTEDVSQFPAYATSRSSRLNAINAGKGFAHTRWQQGEWSVSLIWDHRDYITLRYDLISASAGSTSDEGL